MTSWNEAKAKLHAANPALKHEYDKLNPRFEALSKLIEAKRA